MKIRQAKADKERKMKEFDNMAKQEKAMSATEEALRKKHADADAMKAKKLDDMKEMAKVNAGAYNIGSIAICPYLYIYLCVLSCSKTRISIIKIKIYANF